MRKYLPTKHNANTVQVKISDRSWISLTQELNTEESDTVQSVSCEKGVQPSMIKYVSVSQHTLQGLAVTQTGSGVGKL